MSQLLSCPQGHQWRPTEGAVNESTCPICGAAGQRADAEVATGTYHAPVEEELGSEVETIPPSGEISVSGQGRPAALPATEELAPPPVIPGYEILGELGRGGMGRVYRARQSKLDRLVALKILPSETSRDSNFAERFTREARALAKLNHANIVTVYDFGQTDSLSYFVMEYVDGANLRQLLKSGPVSPQETLQIMSQICDALQYAHDEGIVHRDIKPENILRDKRGRVKIADFGIAKLLARTTKDYTLTGPWQVLGTFHYMAPEQIENPLSLDHRADIYSLGVLFYEMLTGGLPIGRFSLPSQKAKIDARIDEVVLKALEKEPELRYQHVSELKAAVDELLRLVDLRTQPVTDPRLGAMPIPSPARASGLTAAEATSQMEVSKDRVRQRLKGLALGLMVTGCIGCILGLVGLLLVFWALIDVGPRNVSIVANWLFIVATIGLLQGSVVLIGARQIQKLEAYQFAIFSTLVAMLPCSPGFLIGLPMGLWALITLLGPEVRAAFRGGYFEAKPIAIPVRKSPFKQLFATTTGWAIILSFVGCLRTLLPWADLQVPMSNSVFTVMASVNGYETTFGIMTALVFLVLLLVLLATGFIEPVPRWRPGVLFVAGISCILLPILSAGRLSVAEPMSSTGHTTLEGKGFSLGISIDNRGTLYRAGGMEVRTAATWDQVVSQSRVVIREGAYTSFALGFVFLILGALQLRGMLMRTHQQTLA
jgi:predicted Ser/Thr protein kinase